MNSDENAEDFWSVKDYYEKRSVKSGRKLKSCARCGKYINIGEPSDTHKFYPEFYSADTHPECTQDFIANLKTESNE